MRDGTAKRSQLQLPVVLVSKYRGSKGRSATVDCCSSDLSVPDGKQGTIFARGTSVSSPFRVYSARNVTGARKRFPPLCLRKFFEFAVTACGRDYKEFECLRSISL